MERAARLSLWTPGALAASVIAGALAGALTDVRPATAWAAAMAAAALAVACDRPAGRRGFVALMLALSACGQAARARDLTLDPPLATWLAASRDTSASDRRLVTIEGRLVRDALVSDEGARLLVNVDRAIGIEGAQALSARVQLSVGGRFARDKAGEWRAGRRVTVPVTLREAPVHHNPGGSSPRWQALTRPFALVASAKSATLVAVVPGRVWDEAAAEARVRVRGGVARAFERLDAADAKRSAAIVTAILIGDRTGLDPDTESRLRTAGTYHVLAISGGNVALVTALAFLGVRFLVRSHRATVLASMTLVTAYGWVVGGDPSVSRAVTAASVYLALSLGGLVVSGVRVLTFVAMLLVAADPLSVVDAGAWLSFGATLGIVVMATEFRVRRRMREHRRRWLWPVSLALGLVAATAAAELVLLPVHAAVFNRIGVAGLALNLVAIPAMAVVQLAGASAVALEALSLSAAEAAAQIAHIGVRVLVDSSLLVELAPWLSWRVRSPPALVVVAFYIALLAALTGTSRPRAWSSRAACAALAIGAVGIATAAGLELSRPARGWIRLTMLDVGQGEALVVQLPGGRTLLVDAGGGTPRFDVGERVIAPTLWSLGVRRLTWLAITHPDLDHIGGAMSVATIFGPDEIWEGVPVDGELTRLALLAHARREGIGRRRLQRGDVVEAGGVVVTVVSPALSDWERVRTRNDDSLVLRVRYGDVEWLLTGDVGAGVERQWLAEPTDALIRVLKVPHHGSRWSSSANLLDGYRPHLAVVSVGAQNLFGHPAPEVLARFQARRIPVFRTDTSGAVVMESDGHELRVRTMTGERTTVRISR